MSGEVIALASSRLVKKGGEIQPSAIVLHGQSHLVSSKSRVRLLAIQHTYRTAGFRWAPRNVAGLPYLCLGWTTRIDKECLPTYIGISLSVVVGFLSHSPSLFPRPFRVNFFEKEAVVDSDTPRLSDSQH